MAPLSNTQDNSPVRVISTETIRPLTATKTRRLELTPWDLSMLSVHYIEKGILFTTPGEVGIEAVVARLKASLSLSLVQFFPLAGRLVSTTSEDGKETLTYLHCNGQGTDFTRAVADGVTVGDVLAPGEDIPRHLIRRFFPLDLAMNHDAHTNTIPLLAVQLTELVDGIFLACSLNHVAVDGTSFWHFFNSWAEICRDHFRGDVEEIDAGAISKLIKKVQISRPPVHDHWFFDGRENPIPLPFSHPDVFIHRFGCPLDLRERLFHFSAKDMAVLKARANNSNCKNEGEAAASDDIIISSFQALCALVWRALTRANRYPKDHPTSFFMSIDCRRRLQPPLSSDYFGNSVNRIATTTTAGELLSHDLRWASLLLNRTIAGQADRAIRDALQAWTAAPVIFQPSKAKSQGVYMTSSPRFDMYDGSDFGWGRPVAARCGGANKLDGKITAYPGREGGGCVDLELTLVPETMAALLLDDEFTIASSTPAIRSD